MWSLWARIVIPADMTSKDQAPKRPWNHNALRVEAKSQTKLNMQIKPYKPWFLESPLSWASELKREGFHKQAAQKKTSNNHDAYDKGFPK